MGGQEGAGKAWGGGSWGGGGGTRGVGRGNDRWSGWHRQPFTLEPPPTRRIWAIYSCQSGSYDCATIGVTDPNTSYSCKPLSTKPSLHEEGEHIMDQISFDSMWTRVCSRSNKTNSQLTLVICQFSDIDIWFDKLVHGAVIFGLSWWALVQHEDWPESREPHTQTPIICLFWCCTVQSSLT